MIKYYTWHKKIYKIEKPYGEIYIYCPTNIYAKWMPLYSGSNPKYIKDLGFLEITEEEVFLKLL